MRRTINIILYSLSSILLLWAIILGGRGWARHKAEVKCQGLCVCVSDSACNKFIDDKGLLELIEREFDGVVNVHLQRISLTKLEKMLTDKPYLNTAQAYFTADDMLHVNVSQFTPVFKYSTAGKTYYIDSEGRNVKVTDDWKNDLLEIRGEADLNDEQWMSKAGQMVQWLRSNGHQGRIQEIKVKNGELTLKLDGVFETFDFGTLEDYEGKWNKIEKYLKHIAPARKEQAAYKTVCVKYKGQIVCK